MHDVIKQHIAKAVDHIEKSMVYRHDPRDFKALRQIRTTLRLMCSVHNIVLYSNDPHKIEEELKKYVRTLHHLEFWLNTVIEHGNWDECTTICKEIGEVKSIIKEYQELLPNPGYTSLDFDNDVQWQAHRRRMKELGYKI